MISLSSVFKPYQVRAVSNPAKITSRIQSNESTDQELQTQQEEQSQTVDQVVVETMLADAKLMAEEIVSTANQAANDLKDHTQAEIEAWWAERRAEDEQRIQQATETGFTNGYEEGVKLAEAEVRQQYEDVVTQAEQLVEQAFIVKNQIIAEAEPFLLELSVKIAEKIIQKQLTLEESYIKELIQKQLQRKREKGVITLCVAPAQFMLMNASREELSRSIDAQADLQIIPDASVQDMGCVIRSAYGTIDARIETQLTEIKKALYSVLLADEEVK
jgi:flagellar assembly protein FliH